MLKEIYRIWQDFRPRISYKAKEDKIIISCMAKLDQINDRHTWAVIRPVISSLKELEKNTWDVERVEHIIYWLENNFNKNIDISTK